MHTDYKMILEMAETQKKSINAKLTKIKKHKQNNNWDNEVRKLHNKAFEEIDCLKCANCCSTTSPIFTKSDVSSISKLMGYKVNSFKDEFLKVDDEGDYVLQKSPCHFLQDDCKCVIYDKRPKACEGFPHTDEYPIKKILKITQNNIKICPAVAYIFINLKID